MKRLIVGLILLVVLAVAADRVALAAAQTELATGIQSEEHLARRPTVALRGSPFLTQALSGHYTGGRVTIAELTVDKLRLKNLVVDLTDVSVPLGDLVVSRVRQVPVGLVTGTALITYADLAAATGVAGLQIRPKGDELELEAPVTYLGQTVRVVASARVGVQGGALRITSGQVRGVPLPSAVANAALGRLAAAVPLDNLPYGMTVQSFRVTAAGLEVTALSRNAVLRTTQP
ncbi:MAG: hypothetical protein DLM59_16875 [Pseudonocardiales bacterium]|nr:MAG: hypothetical protein DLM59_16875 [Pseudonocardiales bacterium]